MKSPLVGKDPDDTTEGKRRRGQQRLRWVDGIAYTMDMSSRKLWEMVKDREACPWLATVHGAKIHKNSQKFTIFYGFHIVI